jgi:RHS repeat-associated protein
MENTAVFEDRLGSQVWRSGVKTGYYPYGEEKEPGTKQERQKFGTYFRDEVTRLDYAEQRYYSTTMGRFLSADPYVSSGGVGEPQGWNRYAYVVGDPANFDDPSASFLSPINHSM